MIESFKKGGKVPKRVAWEIILGVKDLVMQEKSLVEVDIPEGVTCDVVGDSESFLLFLCRADRQRMEYVKSRPAGRAILTC